MNPSERRNSIIEILCVRRFETIANLAQRLDVSVRTICRDIVVLSCTYPIETVRGRYGGGVKMAEWYHSGRTMLTAPQKALLLKLRPTLSGLDLEVMDSILAQFALYWTEKNTLPTAP